MSRASQRLALRLLAAGLAGLPAARALEPRDLLLLVNSNSSPSLLVAVEYAHLRGVPAENVVYLSLPNSVLEPKAEMSPEDFTRFIWEPARRAAAERGLEDHILAWVYSADFPVRITTWPPISLQGITFVRNQPPPVKDIEGGTYRSPLFAGPDQPGGPRGPGRGLRWFREFLGDRMPLPSMMLGYAGARGNETDVILQYLRRAASSDGTRPTGTVYFVVSDDVRSKCRDWQYPEARAELAEAGVDAAIVSVVPDGAPVLGLLMGKAGANDWAAGDVRYLPGCLLEHLTSMSAIFHEQPQVKLTHWLDRGAAASAGAVSEPRAIWTKFPAARFFVHYANGFTMLESLFLSIRCPLQLLLIGDPLASPWGVPRAAEAEPPAPAATNHPPVIRDIGSTPREGGGLLLTATAEDADGDPLTYDWLQPLPLAPADAGVDALSPVLSGGSLERSNSMSVFTPAHALDTWLLEIPRKAGIREVQVDVCVNPLRWDFLKDQVLGLVFGGRSASDLRFFGLVGDENAWVLGEVRGKALTRRVSRGRPINANRWYRLGVRWDDSEVLGLVNGEVVCRQAVKGPLEGSVGILAGGQRGFFRGLAVGPPAVPPSLFDASGARLGIRDPAQAPIRRVTARAGDGRAVAVRDREF